MTEQKKKINKGGRPAVKRKEREAKETLAQVLTEAEGDPIKVMQLMLKYGAKLNLDVTTALRMARELAPYEKPKLSSVEQKTVDVGAPIIVFQSSQDIKEVDYIEEKNDE